MAADKLAPRVNTKGKVTVDTDKAAWNSGLVELAVLGCHPGDGDEPEALAPAVHQLRQATDLPDALSLPLPLHLAGLAQEYVLPTRNDADAAGVGDADPDTAAAPVSRRPQPRRNRPWRAGRRTFRPSRPRPKAIDPRWRVPTATNGSRSPAWPTDGRDARPVPSGGGTA